MTLTQRWTPEQYRNHIIENNLYNIWYGWCNPNSVNGIRVSAYTPLYNDINIKTSEKKCTKKSCKNGTYKIQEDSHQRKILYKKVCNVCNASQTILYRWISQYDNTKIYFDSPEIVKKYSLLGRAFYGTLTLYDKKIVPPKGMYVDEGLMKAHTLGIDIDINEGTICDLPNKEEIDKCLHIIRESLDTFVPNSYNLQTSGNGIYVFLHHKLCTKDIRYTMSQYNSYIKYLQRLCDEKGITKVKIDPINMPSRVYKLIGSIHQKYDLVCIPLDYDCRLSQMNSESFKLKNFNINNFIIDGKLQFYNRVDEKERINLYKFLEEHSSESEHSNTRAYKHKFNETMAIGSDAISEENQFDSLKRSYNEKLKQMSDDEFMNYHVGWKKFDIDISGRVIYKNNTDGTKTIEMIGVPKEKHREIREAIWKL
ncbi:MAG: hypothetical protein PHP08_00030 [Candidatus Dojkabacteria bacterium]|nr:hypothetical protein [Candidatus Dojkabacteria bacterium]